MLFMPWHLSQKMMDSCHFLFFTSSSEIHVNIPKSQDLLHPQTDTDTSPHNPEYLLPYSVHYLPLMNAEMSKDLKKCTVVGFSGIRKQTYINRLTIEHNNDQERLINGTIIIAVRACVHSPRRSYLHSTF